MKIGKYETDILAALKDRIKPPQTHPRRAFWWPTDGWITDPDEIIRAIRLDDDIGVTTVASSDHEPAKTQPEHPKAPQITNKEDK